MDTVRINFTNISISGALGRRLKDLKVGMYASGTYLKVGMYASGTYLNDASFQEDPKRARNKGNTRR